MMEWRSFHPVSDDGVIRAVEERMGVPLPRDYVEIALAYSGGIPRDRLFMVKERERVFNRLVSVDAGKHPNLLDALDWVDAIPGRTVIPFATDPFGNMLCFTYINPTHSTVTFLDAETGVNTPIAGSFTTFIQSLKSR